MTEDTKKAIIARVKSLAWRLGGVIVVAILGYVAGLIPSLNVPQTWATIIALVLNELTKIANDTWGKSAQ